MASDSTTPKGLIPPFLRIPLAIDLGILISAMASIFGAATWVTNEISRLVEQNQALINRVQVLEVKADQNTASHTQLQVLQARTDATSIQLIELKKDINARFDRLEDKLDLRTINNGSGMR